MEDKKVLLEGVVLNDNEEITEDTLNNLSNNRGEDE